MESVSIIMPVYNERTTIQRVVDEWVKELAHYPLTYTIILCEDGSTDGTAEFLKSLKKVYPMVLSQTKKRRGYGKAMIEGIRLAQSAYILCVDSDGSYDPSDFRRLWNHRFDARVVRGYRRVRMDNSVRKLCSFLFRIVFQLLFPSHVPDPSCPYVLFRKDTISPHLTKLTYLNEGFWWGFVALCTRLNVSMHHVPVAHLPRTNGATRVYWAPRVPAIALRNLLGLGKLKLAH